MAKLNTTKTTIHAPGVNQIAKSNGQFKASVTRAANAYNDSIGNDALVRWQFVTVGNSFVSLLANKDTSVQTAWMMKRWFQETYPELIHSEQDSRCTPIPNYEGNTVISWRRA